MEYGKEVPLAAVLSSLSTQRGGKRNRQLRDKAMTALALQGLKDRHPILLASEGPLSLTVDTMLQIAGQDLLVPSVVAPTQTNASLKIWDDGLGNYTVLEAIGPGKLGDHIQVTIATPDGGPVVTDSDQTTVLPKVAITPQAGNYAATLTLINQVSRLIRAVQVGTGGTMASLAATQLAGGMGEGVRVLFGSTPIFDNRQHGLLFNSLANRDRLRSFGNDGMVVALGAVTLNTIIPGTPAVGAMVLLAVEYAEPMWRTELPLFVAA